MKTKEVISVIAILLVIGGCKKKEQEQSTVAVRPSPPIVIEFKAPEPVKYVYNNAGRRDPFVPLLERRLGRMAPGEKMAEMEVVVGTEEAGTEATGLETFEISGLVWDSQGEVGLVTGENNKSFTLFNGELLNEEGNPLEDIKGKREKDEIVLTKKDKSVALKIKEKEYKEEGEVK